jgi:hypothetical protein
MLTNKSIISIGYKNIYNHDFSCNTFNTFAVAESIFSNCDFGNVRIEDASFGGGRRQSTYTDCNFDGARIGFGTAGNARFVRCSFENVDLRHWCCFAVELIDCSFSGALRHSYFNGTLEITQQRSFGRKTNRFHGNDFSGLDLIDVAFRSGIDLTQQRLPTGQHYLYVPNAPGAVQRARLDVMRWTDLDEREDGIALIDSLEREASEGQAQLLLRRDEHRVFSRDVVEKVLSLLVADDDEDLPGRLPT